MKFTRCCRTQLLAKMDEAMAALQNKFENEEACEEKACMDAPVIPGQLDPPNRQEIGRSTWKYIHHRAHVYPEEPTIKEMNSEKLWVAAFTYLYPCKLCAHAFFEDVLSKEQPNVKSRLGYENWWCRAHNIVRDELSQPHLYNCDDCFPCNKS